ncbi:hypothetical protein [Dyadobacter bucti]|uniref:hypothetical protein n=1 Tax=Dyadobacter bucti TaxID=2572203 RepID=UPI001109C43F|nr:hypothetical protein [Dyadobacter bucti]
MNTDYQYKRATETFKLLAASYDEQKTALPDFADSATDIVTSFEDIFLLLPQLVEMGFFSLKAIASILRAYNKMQWCLENLDIDDFSNQEWNKLRDLAKDILFQIGETDGDIDLRYV